VTARIVERSPEGGRVKVRAEGRTHEGKPTAVAECWMDLAHRASVERAGIALPSYLLDEMAP
jgi:hypothetical protein